MTKMYRFRSTTNLLGDFQELEKQSIYFVSPEELNDPMEGFRDIVWQGDRIVWTNLFRHYLYCLYWTYLLFKFVGDNKEVEPQDIPIIGPQDQQMSPKAVKLFEDICGRVFEKENIHDFITSMVNTKRKARHDEMRFYLQSLHYTALLEIQAAFIDHGFFDHELVPDSKKLKIFPSIFKVLHNISDLAQQIEDEKFLDTGFAISSSVIEERIIYHKYNAKSESNSTFEKNRQLLIFDFPRVYLKQIGELLYLNWYVACFMRDYHNSSAWGHYGDNHKGVCLIFEAETTGKMNCLTLNQITGYSNDREVWNPSLRAFYEVNYQDKIDEIDFFRSIGCLPITRLKKAWYSDQNGNLSECGAHLGTGGDELAWRENYWANFYRDITAKTKDWEYEQESRLILYSMLTDLREKRQRTLTYNFSSLKGIIFGINTSDSDKVEIIEIINKKCQENNRTDFEFFQAYYCPETGNIQKHKLHLPLSV